MFNIGSQELLLILLLVFLFFGPRHLPGVARTLGKGLGDFQRTLKGVEDNFRRATEETERVARPMASIFDPELAQDVPAAIAAPAPPATEGDPKTVPSRQTDRDDDPDPPDPTDLAVNPS